MKKTMIFLSSLMIILVFVVSGYSEGKKTRKIASASQIEGRWSGAHKDPGSKPVPIEAVFFVEGKKIVGFFKVSDSSQRPFSGYIDADSGKAIIKDWYDDRIELKLSQDGTKLSGGTYILDETHRDIEFTRVK